MESDFFNRKKEPWYKSFFAPITYQIDKIKERQSVDYKISHYVLSKENTSKDLYFEHWIYTFTPNKYKKISRATALKPEFINKILTYDSYIYYSRLSKSWRAYDGNHGFDDYVSLHNSPSTENSAFQYFYKKYPKEYNKKIVNSIENLIKNGKLKEFEIFEDSLNNNISIHSQIFTKENISNFEKCFKEYISSQKNDIPKDSAETYLKDIKTYKEKIEKEKEDFKKIIDSAKNRQPVYEYNQKIEKISKEKKIAKEKEEQLAKEKEMKEAKEKELENNKVKAKELKEKINKSILNLQKKESSLLKDINTLNYSNTKDFEKSLDDNENLVKNTIETTNDINAIKDDLENLTTITNELHENNKIDNLDLIDYKDFISDAKNDINKTKETIDFARQTSLVKANETVSNYTESAKRTISNNNEKEL